MANDNRPQGLVPSYHLNGFEIVPVRFVKDTTTGIGKGDLVVIASDGKVDRWISAAGLALGVAAEAAATNVAATIGVYIDPNIVYTLQSTASLTQTVVGNGASITATAYNTTLGLSKYQLGAVGTVVSGTFPVQILGLSKAFNTDGSPNAFGSFVKLDVRVSRSYLMAAAAYV